MANKPEQRYEFELRSNSAEAVSYTHLDVYKRQNPERKSFFTCTGK